LQNIHVSDKLVKEELTFDNIPISAMEYMLQHFPLENVDIGFEHSQHFAFYDYNMTCDLSSFNSSIVELVNLGSYKITIPTKMQFSFLSKLDAYLFVLQSRKCYELAPFLIKEFINSPIKTYKKYFPDPSKIEFKKIIPRVGFMTYNETHNFEIRVGNVYIDSEKICFEDNITIASFTPEKNGSYYYFPYLNEFEYSVKKFFVFKEKKRWSN